MRSILPTKREFLDSVHRGMLSPLSMELDIDSVTPLSALESMRGLGYATLLESCRIDKNTGRYSFVTAEPYLVFRSRSDEIELSLPALPTSRYGSRVFLKRKPLHKLRELMSNYRTIQPAGLPPFTGGVVGFLSYDFVHNFERLPRTVRDDLGIPEAYFIFVDAVVAFDHIANRAWLIVNPGARKQELGFRHIQPDEWPGLYDEAVARVERISTLLSERGPSSSSSSSKAICRNPGLIPEMTKASFISMVQRCKEYIAAGDIYQANLSQRFSADIAGLDPWSLYQSLRRVNPSPFAAFLDFPDVQIVSSSPERLVRLMAGKAETRPIAGTRRRGQDFDETMQLKSELLTNEKERAEHIMLLDLERNDLGKVCEYGSVRVDELMVVEDYSHVIHIVSNVSGRLASGRDAFDLIRALFPGGTITGVPKVRCMEIIDELEPVARGPYTGSIGYVSNSGEMDINIIIRTFVIKNGRAFVQTGAGIVADSDPEREYMETLQKAEALKQALSMLQV